MLLTNAPQLFRIHCTNMSCYSSEEVVGPVYSGMTCDEIKLGRFKVHNASPGVFGRCFIEVGLIQKFCG